MKSERDGKGERRKKKNQFQHIYTNHKFRRRNEYFSTALIHWNRFRYDFFSLHGKQRGKKWFCFNMLASLVHFINYKSGVRIITRRIFFLITQPTRYSGCRFFFRSLVLNIPFIFSTHYMSSAHLNRLINWLYQSHNEKSYYIFQILWLLKTRKKNMFHRSCFSFKIWISFSIRFGYFMCVCGSKRYAC